MNETITIQKDWLKTLVRLSDECKKAQDEWFKTEKPLMPTCISKLIGFASSSKTIINLKT